MVRESSSERSTSTSDGFCAGDGGAHRFGPGCKKKPIEGDFLPVGERDLVRLNVEADNGRSEPQVDGVVRIEARRAKRDPLLRRAAYKIVLGQVGPVDRRRIVAAEHDDFAPVFPPPQHLRGGEPGSASADDHDSIRPA